jgi:hypothetical protein
MFDWLITLIGSYGALPVIFIILLSIPGIIKVIEWCKGLWQKRENFRQECFDEGVASEKKHEAKE